MARIGSPFIITGTLGEVDSYVDGGVFHGKDIGTRPEMGGVRENGREFGHCSKVKSVSITQWWACLPRPRNGMRYRAEGSVP